MHDTAIFLPGHRVLARKDAELVAVERVRQTVHLFPRQRPFPQFRQPLGRITNAVELLPGIVLEIVALLDASNRC